MVLVLLLIPESGRLADTACLGRCHAPFKSRRTSPTGDERHNKRKSGPARADSLKESQLAAGRDHPQRVGRHRRAQSQQQASKEQRGDHWSGCSTRCPVSSDSAASGRGMRCARTAPLPRSRSVPLHSWSSSDSGASRQASGGPECAFANKRPVAGFSTPPPSRIAGRNPRGVRRAFVRTTATGSTNELAVTRSSGERF